MATSQRQDLDLDRRWVDFCTVEMGGGHHSLLSSPFLKAPWDSSRLVFPVTAALLRSPAGLLRALRFYQDHARFFSLGSAPASGMFTSRLRSHFYLHRGDNK